MELISQLLPQGGIDSQRINLELPFSVWVQFTKKTNHPRCKLNYDVEDPGQVELSAAEIVEYLTPLFERGLNAAFIEGGEPLLRPDWPLLTRFIARHAFTILRTNGTQLSEHHVQHIADSNVGVVCVDLHGSTAEAHDAVTGVSGSFDEAVSGLKRLVRAGIPTYITCILTRKNAYQLQHMLDICASIGIKKLGVLRLYPIGEARRYWSELSLPLLEQMAAINGLKTPPSVRLMQSWHPYNPNCCWQIGAIDAYGNNVACPYLRETINYGNIRTESFIDMWNMTKYQLARNAPISHSCSECKGNDPNAEGGCRSTAYAFTGKWDAGDPYCLNMNRGIDLTKLPPIRPLASD